MKKKITLFLIFFFLFSFLSLVAFYGFIYAINILRMDTYPYRLSDETYISIQHESNPLQKVDSESLQKKFLDLNTELKKIPSTAYYEFYKQPLFYEGNQISCIQLGLNLQDDLALQVQSGRRFDSSDYVFKSGKPIPVILGSKFQNDFKIDDQFQAEYLFVPYTFQVIGFLAPDSNITLIAQEILNDFILMPSGQFTYHPETEEQTFSQLIHNANRVSGILKLQGENKAEIYDKVIKLLHDAGVGEFSYYSNSIVLDYSMRVLDIQRFRTICFIGILAFLIFAGIVLYCIKKWPILLNQAEKKVFFAAGMAELMISVIGALYLVKKILSLDFIGLRIILIPVLLSVCCFLLLLLYINHQFCKQRF